MATTSSLESDAHEVPRPPEVYNGTPFVDGMPVSNETIKTHLSLLHHRPVRLGEPWNLRAESLKALEQRGARPAF
jgi:hypothetical protein